MATLEQIQRDLDLVQKRLDRMPDERSRILSELFKSRDEGDSKGALRAKSELQDHDIEVESLRQRTVELSEALKHRVRESITDEIKRIPETERQLVDEAWAAAEKLGKLLGEVQFLADCYAPNFLRWLHLGDDAYGKRPELPEGFQGKVYRAASDAMRGRLDELRTAGGNPSTFPARWLALADARSLKRDPNLLEGRLRKKLSIIAHSQRGV